jgi:hypothetical protein
MAKDNGLSGMLYSTICPSNNATDLCRRLQKELYVYLATATTQDEALDDITSLLNNASIRFVLLKGSYLRTLYPEPHMRSMGDIDVLVEPHHMERIHNILDKNGYANPVNGPAHDLFTHPNGVTIEVHPHLARPIDGVPVPLFDAIWDHAHPVHAMEHRLEPNYELVYLIYHLAKHFRSGGIGLRSVLDIGLLGEHHQSDLDWAHIQSMLDEIGYLRFGQSILSLTKEWFQRPNTSFDWPPMDPNLLQVVTRYVSISGVHGTGETFNRAIASLGSSNTRFPKLFRLMRMVFPSAHQLSHRYRFLARTILLYPLAWTMRTVRILFTSTRRVWMTIRRLFIPGKDIKKAASMFEELGL